MTHKERLKMLTDTQGLEDEKDIECDFKAKILFLLEDLVSKVEALGPRPPDFRTKGYLDHGEQ